MDVLLRKHELRNTPEIDEFPPWQLSYTLPARWLSTRSSRPILAAEQFMQQGQKLLGDVLGRSIVNLDRIRLRYLPGRRVIGGDVHAIADVAGRLGQCGLTFFGQTPIDVNLGSVGMGHAINQGERPRSRSDRRSLFKLSGIQDGDGHAALRALLDHAVR